MKYCRNRGSRQTLVNLIHYRFESFLSTYKKQDFLTKSELGNPTLINYEKASMLKRIVKQTKEYQSHI